MADHGRPQVARPERVLFVHTPKAAGNHLIEYFHLELGYPRVMSGKRSARGTRVDFTLDELRAYVDARGLFRESNEAFLSTHVLAVGWDELAFPIPRASREDAVAAIRAFRSAG